MARTSPVHYIAPSAVSIMPNANNTADDIAVNITDGSKIKVFCPRAGLGLVGNQYQEWTLAGRNRRLGDSTKPYTIYARLPKYDKSKGYLIFAEKNGNAAAGWTDKYNYITADDVSVSGLTSISGATTDSANWHIRLGDVSLPENGQRTLTFDTGVLGTDLFNNDWLLNPDTLPLRIELSCIDQNGEDAGPTPYVYWGKYVDLFAVLTEGWTGTDIQRFSHWTIARDSGDANGDTNWNSNHNTEPFRSNGSIRLTHNRPNPSDLTLIDDFNGAVNTTFTITAWGTEENPSGETPEIVPLLQASINIMAETVEKYDLATSADIVSFNPQTNNYTPSGGVVVKVRATDQRGELFNMTNGQVQNASLVASYAAVGSSSWTNISFSGASDEEASATIPTSAFNAQKSINIRLQRAIPGDNNTTVYKDLSMKTVAFVRDGEDSKEREWIFLRSTEPITFGTQEHPFPANISGGQVNPSGAATGDDTNKNQDGWVPQGWYDEQQGVDETNRYEYGAYRDFVHESGNTADHWGAFTDPTIWNHFGVDGDDGLYYKDEFARSKSRTSYASADIDTSYGTDGWGTNAPAADGDYVYIWKRSRLWDPNTNAWASGSSWSYICLTGEDGESIWQAHAFKAFSSDPGSDKPNKTTGITPETTNFGNGWHSSPNGLTGVDYSDVSSWYNNGIVTIPSAGDDGVSLGILRFTTYVANAVIKIKITASSERNFDFGAIGKLDTTSLTGKTYSAIKNDDGTICSAKVSGTETQTIALTVPSAGNHYVQICYAKDSGDEGNNDCAYVEVLTDKVYSSMATVVNGTVSGSWSNATPWEGKNGEDGENGHAYTLKTSLSQLTYNPNGPNPGFVGPSGFTVTRLDNGLTSTEGSIAVYPVDSNNNRGSAISPSAQGVYSADSSKIRYDIDWSINGRVVASISVPIVKYGEKGNAGHVGRWYYYAGPYSSLKQYTLADTQAPYVQHGTDSNRNPKFYMLDNAANDGVNGSWTDYSPDDYHAGNPWTEMQSTHQYYIAQAFFGNYAHFGSFIINDDWMISQHGVIYDTNGGIHTIDANHSYGDYNVNNAYTLFDVDYPNSSKPNDNNFVPNFAVDGRTGATYQNKAHIRGELDVRDLGQNAGWVLSPYLQDYYKIPSIDGFDKDGILTMRLMFDGDDSDGYAPREGGGLLINEKKWNAPDQKYEPYNVARYNREAWCVSGADHPDDSYMFGGMNAEEPLIHGKTYIQSNQTHKEFYLGITSLGLYFQSDSWQTYRSNMQDGEVYVDDWDNLKVKRSSGYKQFNFIYGETISGTNDIVLPQHTSDNPIPDGTTYYVKGNGSSKVWSYTPIMNSHNSSYWPQTNSYYRNTIYGQSHIFLMQTVNGTKVWIDFYASAEVSPD